ncbi:protein takeout-like [Teleopsis dalmanni]|uniref:protein takeout-like n=1 Tax=Teleopsis dalmanni TaxID=139649 RepID=UPI0018CE7C8D|nr:protein takeout-like [Teleopsis dalmanni]
MFNANNLSLLAVWCCSLLAACSCSSNFPADIPRCHAGDTNCITRTSMNLVRQYARTGYPEAAFPVIEPFLLKRFDISDGRESSLSLKLNFKDVRVEGISGVQIDRAVGFDRDPSTSKFEMYGSFPKLQMRGKYTADGRILILPIRGDGDADITIIKPKFSVKFKPSIIVKNGKTYITVDKLKVLIEPERMSISLTNLFNGDQALGNHLNQFLNENWRDVWNELQSSIHVAISEIIRSIITTVARKFAYDDLYLEN